MPQRIVHKIIQVHPPEADAVFNAFREARADTEAILALLRKMFARLDQDWEGNQKTVFEGEMTSSVEDLSRTLLPQLQFWEHKYQTYMTEKVIDVVENY